MAGVEALGVLFRNCYLEKVYSAHLIFQLVIDISKHAKSKNLLLLVRQRVVYEPVQQFLVKLQRFTLDGISKQRTIIYSELSSEGFYWLTRSRDS
jgi:hypothetical protein